MPFYLEMSKNITKQRDIYDTFIETTRHLSSRCLVIYIYIYIWDMFFETPANIDFGGYADNNTP